MTSPLENDPAASENLSARSRSSAGSTDRTGLPSDAPGASLPVPASPASSASEATRSAEPALNSEGSPARGGKRRFEALFELLDDDSPHVWTEVRKELGRASRAVEPGLRRLARAPSARRRARARRVLLDRDRARTTRRLAGLALRPDLDLERALWTLSQLETPSFDARPYCKALDAMARKVSSLAGRPPSESQAGTTTGLRGARALCEYLGGELSYTGASDDYHHPDNVFLHRTIERRTGMPLTLCALYLGVARRAGLRAGIVPLPGHVLLRLYSGPDSMLVDPFHGGEQRSERECLSYLAQHGLEFRPSWFREAADATVFARHVANLRVSWMARGLGFEVRELSRILEALARNPAVPTVQARSR